MAWTYRQSSGELLDPNGAVLAIGYAGGNCGKNPEGKNNPDLQDEPCIGPLPQGRYSFGSPVAHSQLGPFSIPLLPDSANNMCGRSDFFCHGDTMIAGRASEGCIIMPLTIRKQLWDSDDHDLEVVRGN